MIQKLKKDAHTKKKSRCKITQKKKIITKTKKGIRHPTKSDSNLAKK